MPDLPAGLEWRTFVPDIAGRSVPPNGEIELLVLEGDAEDETFIAARNACRRALAPLRLKLEYTDIYGTSMAAKERELKWFGRHVGES